MDRITAHVELSLTELLQRADEEIARVYLDVERKIQGAEGRLAVAESRHAELLEKVRVLEVAEGEAIVPPEARWYKVRYAELEGYVYYNFIATQ